LHTYDKDNVNGQIINSVPLSIVCEHTDITTGVLVLDKLYSVGFDGKLIIYDCPFGSPPKVAKKINHAHDAGITCIIAQKNSIDNSEWLMTGSFDKTAKVWSLDGKMIYKFADFTHAVTGLTYVTATKTVWIGKKYLLDIFIYRIES
jgi:WD40 repeat protein